VISIFIGFFIGIIGITIGHIDEMVQMMKIDLANKSYSNFFITLTMMILLYPFNLFYGMVVGPNKIFNHFFELFEKYISGISYTNYRKEKIEKGRKLILLVDDDEATARIIAGILNETKLYQVIIVSNGLEALEVLKAYRKLFGLAGNGIGCILLDIQMPMMNGIDFLKELRSMEKGYSIIRHTPVILITAYEDVEKWKIAIDNRVFGYIKKPFQMEELLDALRRVFSDYNPKRILENMYMRGKIRIKELNSSL
jgi:putative two-component system response regulator